MERRRRDGCYFGSYCFSELRGAAPAFGLSHSDRKIARPVAYQLRETRTAAEASHDRESAGPTRLSAARVVGCYLSRVHTTRFRYRKPKQIAVDVNRPD